jgi:hypothetical protein
VGLGCGLRWGDRRCSNFGRKAQRNVMATSTAVDGASVGACNCKEDSFVLDDTGDLRREVLNSGKAIPTPKSAGRGHFLILFQ